MIVRGATPDDGPACAAVYAPDVTGTAITVEHEPPTPAGRASPTAPPEELLHR